jgi:hypothetical protein
MRLVAISPAVMLLDSRLSAKPVVKLRIRLLRLMVLLLLLLLLLLDVRPKINALQVFTELQGATHARELPNSGCWLLPATAVMVLQTVHFCAALGRLMSVKRCRFLLAIIWLTESWRWPSDAAGRLDLRIRARVQLLCESRWGSTCRRDWVGSCICWRHLQPAAAAVHHDLATADHHPTGCALLTCSRLLRIVKPHVP